MSVHSRIELEFENVSFEEGGKPRYPGKKNPRSRVQIQQQIRPTYDARSGNRSRDTVILLEASALTTAPSLMYSIILIKTTSHAGHLITE